jgi:hypothetical protein
MTTTTEHGAELLLPENQAAPAVNMRTLSGIKIDFEDPDPADINVGDIVGQLGKIVRFGGATIHPYTVLEHSIYVARMLHRRHADIDLSLAGLFHDAPEAYIGDMNGLLKKIDLMAGFRVIEKRFARAIESALELRVPLDDPRIKAVDVEVFDWECAMIRDTVFRVTPDAQAVGREFYGLAEQYGLPWSRML